MPRKVTAHAMFDDFDPLFRRESAVVVHAISPRLSALVVTAFMRSAFTRTMKRQAFHAETT